MRYFLLFLIAFALAFLGQGDSLPTRHRKEGAASPVLPLQSDVTKGDIVGSDPIIGDVYSPNSPKGGAERILQRTNSGFIAGDWITPQSEPIENGDFFLESTSYPVVDGVRTSIGKGGNSPNVPKRAPKQALQKTSKETKANTEKTLSTSSDITGIRISGKIARFLKSMISEPSSKANADGESHLAMPNIKGAHAGKLAVTNQPVKPDIEKSGKRASQQERHVNRVSPELEFGHEKKPLEQVPRALSKPLDEEISLTEEYSEEEFEADDLASEESFAEIEDTKEQLLSADSSSGDTGSADHVLEGQIKVALTKRGGHSSDGTSWFDKQQISLDAPKKASQKVLTNSKERTKPSKVGPLPSNTNIPGIRFSGKIARLFKIRLIPEPSTNVNADDENHFAITHQPDSPEIEQPGERSLRQGRHVNEVFPELQEKFNLEKGIHEKRFDQDKKLKTLELIPSAVLKPSENELSETGDYLPDYEVDVDWGSGEASTKEETIGSAGSGDNTHEEIRRNDDFTSNHDSDGVDVGEYMSDGDSSREDRTGSQRSSWFSNDYQKNNKLYHDLKEALSMKFRSDPVGFEDPDIPLEEKEKTFSEAGGIGDGMKLSSDEWLSGVVLDEDRKPFIGSGGTSVEFPSSPDPLGDEDEDPDDEADVSSSRKKRTVPDYRDGLYKSHERHIKMNDRNSFLMPKSDFRWKGFAMAHARSRDGGPDQVVNGKKEGEVLRDAVTTLSVVFTVGGSMLVLMFGIIFLFAIWPMRKYFNLLLRCTDTRDVEKGEYTDELSDIRVDGGNPSERPSGCGSTYYAQQFTQRGQTTVPIYQSPGNARKGYEQPRFSSEAIYSQTSGKRVRKSRDKVVAEDKKRDSRNAERRKIIRRQTFEKRGSLVDSLLIAKRVIDGHAKNKEFEDKALERRQKIKQHRSDPGPQTMKNRRKSFAEEVQSACTVIKPNWNDEEKMERSKEKRRKIKQQISSKKRPSLLDQIEVAKDLIVDQ